MVIPQQATNSLWWSTSTTTGTSANGYVTYPHYNPNPWSNSGSITISYDEVKELDPEGPKTPVEMLRDRVKEMCEAGREALEQAA